MEDGRKTDALERRTGVHACRNQREGRTGTYEDGGWVVGGGEGEKKKKAGAEIERGSNNKRK